MGKLRAGLPSPERLQARARAIILDGGGMCQLHCIARALAFNVCAIDRGGRRR